MSCSSKTVSAVSSLHGRGNAVRVGSYFLALLLGVFAGASIALADALVVVEVRAEGEVPPGEVKLVATDREFSCRVEDNGCRIDGVPRGRYRVHFAPDEGEPTRPQTTMIADGTVTLVVPYRAPER
ncbi:MAG: hypothetical protein AAGF12_23470 [Myxococcota bacterium]